MSVDDDSELTEADPIDADFEPAPSATHDAAGSSGKPGWIALGVTGLLAAVIGGAGGAFIGADGYFTSAEAAQNTVASTEKITAVETELAQVRRALDATQAQLKEQDKALAEQADTKPAADELAKALAAQEDFKKELSRFDADLESLDARFNEDAQSEGDTTDKILARLESLERVGDTDETNPCLLYTSDAADE